MILRNDAPQAIAALASAWRRHTADGPTLRSCTSMIGGGPSVLAPFGLDDRGRKLYGYWHTVLPGSKRIIRGNRLLGDNSGVRSPHEDEIWKGGFIRYSGGGGARRRSPLVGVTLALDRVLFLDGGFAGLLPNGRSYVPLTCFAPPPTPVLLIDVMRNFDRFAADVNARLEVARIARVGHNEGLAPAAIFEEIEAVTGARGCAASSAVCAGEEDAEALRRASLQELASQIQMTRQQGLVGGDRLIFTIMSWAGT